MPDDDNEEKHRKGLMPSTMINNIDAPPRRNPLNSTRQTLFSPGLFREKEAALERFNSRFTYDQLPPNHPQSPRMAALRGSFIRTHGPVTKATTRGGKFVLGTGAFGKVRLAYDLLLDKPVAVKSMRQRRDGTGEVKEGEFLKRIRSRFVISAIETYHVGKTNKDGKYVNKTYIAMECAGPCVLDLVNSGMRLSEAQVVGVLHQVAQGIEDCFASDVAPTDIKMANIAPMEDGRVVLLDLGCAIDLRSSPTPESARHESVDGLMILALHLLRSCPRSTLSDDAKAFLAICEDIEELRRANCGEAMASTRTREIQNHPFWKGAVSPLDL